LLTILRYFIYPSELSWEIEAKTLDKTTIVNICNHSYWNLEGLDSTIDNMEIKLNSSSFMPVDENCFPSGEIVDLSKSSIGDLSLVPKKFAQLFQDFGDIDNNFFLNGYQEKKKESELKFAVELYSSSTGICMSVFTTEPCIQIYTGNFLNSNILTFGKSSQKHGALCIETQRPPNAINNPSFSNMIILPVGKVYYNKTVHKFSTR